jgi:hypothetical protein
MTQFVTEYLGQGQQELSQLLNKLQEDLQVLLLARDLKSTSERLRKLSKKITLVLHTHIEQQEQILYPALEGHMQGLAATLVVVISKSGGTAETRNGLLVAEEAYRRTVDSLGEAVPARSIAWISLGGLRFMPSLRPLIHQRFPGSRIAAQEMVRAPDGKFYYGYGDTSILAKEHLLKRIPPDVDLVNGIETRECFQPMRLYNAAR